MAVEEALRSIGQVKADSTLAVYTGVPGMPGSADPNSGNQFKFVKLSDVRTAVLATGAANEDVLGVLQNKPQYTGEACTIAISGVSRVRVGAAISAVGGVKVDSTGRVVPWVAGTDDQDLRVGTALETATTADQLISVLLQVGH